MGERQIWEGGVSSYSCEDGCIDDSSNERFLRGKGGDTSKFYRDKAYRLIPCAAEKILEFVREKIENESPEELKKPFTLHSKHQRDGSLHEDLHKNRDRRNTIAFHHPSYGLDYVAASSELFKARVCSWTGDVKDAYIGPSRGDEKQYSRVKANERVEVVESSEDKGDSNDDCDVQLLHEHLNDEDHDLDEFMEEKSVYCHGAVCQQLC